MSVSVRYWLESGTSYTIDENGATLTIDNIVEGLTGAAADRLAAAMNAIPYKIGDKLERPGYAEYRLYISSKTATPIDGGKTVRVTVVAKSPDSQDSGSTGGYTSTPVGSSGYNTTASATVQQVQTMKDITGAQMFVEHEYPSRGKIKQAGVVDKFVPQVEMTLHRKMLKSEIQTRGWEYLHGFVGTVNTENCSPFQSRAGVWLCCGLDASPVEADGTDWVYDMAWRFQRSEDPTGWHALIVFIDPETGKPPIGVVEGDGGGLKKYQIYEYRDFGELGLSL